MSLSAPLLDSGTFDRVPSVDYGTWRTCDAVGESETKLHRFLTDMAASSGIGRSEERPKLSLFELPALLEGAGRHFFSMISWMQCSPHSLCQLEDTYKSVSTMYLASVPHECEIEWGDFIAGDSFDHPCHSRASSVCCPIAGISNLNLSSVMRLMKFASSRGRSHYDFKHANEPFNQGGGMFERDEMLEPARLDGTREIELNDYDTHAPYCFVQRRSSARVSSEISYQTYPVCKIMGR